MSRDLGSAFAAELDKQKLRPCIFVQGEFVSGSLYVWSGSWQVSWNGHTWLPGAGLMAISALPETEDVNPTGVTVSLSGIPNAYLTKALAECRLSQKVRIWFGAMDESGAILADPFQVFGGMMDAPVLDEGGDTSSIAIAVENRMINLQRASGRNYTHQDQQIDHSGDLGFIYVPTLQEMNLVWAKGSNIPSRSLGNGRQYGVVQHEHIGNIGPILDIGPGTFPDQHGSLSPAPPPPTPTPHDHR